MIVGRAIADARVAARPVVERGDVIENDESRFLAGRVLVVVDELGLEGIEEALGQLLHARREVLAACWFRAVRGNLESPAS